MATLHRREVAILGKKLKNPLDVGDEHQQRYLLSRVLSYAEQGEDCSLLLPSMVKLLAHRDLCIKKMAGEILIHHSADSAEMVLLAINTLIQDTEESNPMIRGLALKTLSLLQQESVIEHLERIISKALADDSAYVRRIAVLACLKLHEISPSTIKENDFIDTLYGMIRDPDPFVVVNCLSALEEILKDEGGIVINKAIAGYLLHRLNTFPTWSLMQIVNILKKYSPATDDEMFEAMNLSDWCLENNSPALVAVCIELFLHFLHTFPHLQSEVFKRSQVTLVRFLTKDNVEVSSSIIDIIADAPKEALTHFYQSYESFFCHNRDPAYLKLKKISLLCQLVTEDNGEAILEQLSLYCVSRTHSVSLKAVQAIGLLHQQQHFLSAACLTKLCNFMHSASPHVLSNLLQVLQSMPIIDKNFWAKLISPLCQNFHNITDVQGRAALLYIIGEHLQDSEEAFAVIEDCVENFSDLEEKDVKDQLLTAATKMFLIHPLELQSLLGELLETAVADKDLEVCSRAQFLYQLLESGIDTAKVILFDAHAKTGSDLIPL